MSFYDIKIEGKDVKRFIRNLYKMHINFYKINYLNKSVIIKVSKEDYLKILKIKTIYKVDIIKYYGIVKYKHFINKYKIFLISIIFGIILLLLLTNIIFSVTINTDNKELKERLFNSLKEEKISKYNFIVPFKKKEKIKEKLLLKYNDEIEWLEIKRIGTKYIIELEERKKKNTYFDKTPRNIVAKKNGIITKIIGNSGEIITKVDQYVKKGDILISGIIHKNEDVVDITRADGKIYAETWYTVTVELPYHYNEEVKTGKRQTTLNINFLNKSIKLFNLKKLNNVKSKTIYSINNQLLPISISLNKDEEVKLIDQIYTLDNAYFKASSIASKKLKEKLDPDSKIIFEKKLKTVENNSKIEVVIFYKVIENITDYKTIEENGELEEVR